jgi:hypothetical protein
MKSDHRADRGEISYIDFIASLLTLAMMGTCLAFGIYRKKRYLALAFGMFSGLVSCITPVVAGHAFWLELVRVLPFMARSWRRA